MPLSALRPEPQSVTDCEHVRTFITALMEAPPPVPMLERYTACMVLAGVGDAMGYRNGRWEFNFSGAHRQPQRVRLRH